MHSVRRQPARTSLPEYIPFRAYAIGKSSGQAAAAIRRHLHLPRMQMMILPMEP
jgi:hypothetical protein